MTGELNLELLLRDMNPVMQEGIFVFCTLPEGGRLPRLDQSEAHLS
jgi:hypothetical protein